MRKRWQSLATWDFFINITKHISLDSNTLFQMMSEHFPACVRLLNSVKSPVFGGPHERPSWIEMLIRPWGRVCYNPWCNVLRKALVFNGHHWTKFEGQFEDVWKPQNLDFLALQEIVSIKNHKATGLRLKMVFLMICTPMIFTMYN